MRRWRWLLLPFALAFLAACSCNLRVPPAGIQLGWGALQSQFAHQFPKHKNFNQLVDIQLQLTSLEPDPAAPEQLRIQLAMQADSRLHGTMQRYTGTLQLHAQVAHNARQHSLILLNPEVTDFDLGPQAEARMGHYKAIARGLLSRWLADELQRSRLHTLSLSEQRQLGQNRPFSIQLHAGGIQLQPY